MRKFALVAIAASLSGCITASQPPAPVEAAKPLPSPSELRELTAAEKALLTKGFAAGLKDPGSAQFQWARIRKDLPSDGIIDYCAVVNAKNSYGGYIGATPFLGKIQVTNGKIAAGMMGAVGYTERQYADLLPKMCRNAGVDPYS